MVWAQRVVEQCEREGRPLMVILDEAHDALNPRSATGRVIRILKNGASAPPVYSTATSLREPRGVDLYDRLLPGDMSVPEVGLMLDTVIGGGEAAQESLTTMLTEDGRAVAARARSFAAGICGSCPFGCGNRALRGRDGPGGPDRRGHDGRLPEAQGSRRPDLPAFPARRGPISTSTISLPSGRPTCWGSVRRSRH